MERLTVKDLEKLLKGETKTYRFKTAKALDNARSYVYAYGARYNVKLSTEKKHKNALTDDYKAMRKEDTGVWTVEFRPKEVRELLEGLKQSKDTEDFTKKIHELEELLGLI